MSDSSNSFSPASAGGFVTFSKSNKTTFGTSAKRCLALATGGYDASTYTYSNTSYSWVWKWACGPEAGDVIGIQNANSSGMTTTNYANWVSGEPNGKNIPNTTSYEGFGQYGYRTGGLWNDLRDRVCGGIQGYYVEYGGYVSDNVETKAAADTRKVSDLTSDAMTVAAASGTSLTVSSAKSGVTYAVLDADGKVVMTATDDDSDGKITFSDLTSGATYRVVEVASDVTATTGQTLISSAIVQESGLVTLASPVTVSNIEQTEETATNEDGTKPGTISITLPNATETGKDYALIDQTTGEVIGWTQGTSDGVTFEGLDPSHSYAAVSATHAAGGEPLLAESGALTIYPAPLFDQMSAEYDAETKNVALTVENPVNGADYYAVLTDENGTTTKVGPGTANADGTVTIKGLDPGTDYTIVAVAKSKSPDSNTVGTEITTPSAPSEAAGKASRASNDKTTDTVTISNSNSDLKYALMDQNGSYVDQNGTSSETPVWVTGKGEGEGEDPTWTGLDPYNSYTVVTAPKDSAEGGYVFPTEVTTLVPLADSAGVTAEGVTITVSPADTDRVYALLDSKGNVVQTWTAPGDAVKNSDGSYTAPYVAFSGLELGTEYTVVSAKSGVTGKPNKDNTVVGTKTTDNTAVIPASGGKAQVEGVTVSAEDNTGDITVKNAGTDEDGKETPATVTVAKAGDSFTADKATLAAGQDEQEFTVTSKTGTDENGNEATTKAVTAALDGGESVTVNGVKYEAGTDNTGDVTVTVNTEDGTVAVSVGEGDSVSIGGKAYTGPASLTVDEAGKVTVLELLGATATTLTLQGAAGAKKTDYTVLDSSGNEVQGANVTVDKDGKVTVSGLTKGKEYTISGKYGDVTAATSAVSAVEIAKAFDNSITEKSDTDNNDQITGSESSKVTVTVDGNGNYVVTLLGDITAEDTGAETGEATVTVGDNWGSVTLDLNGHTISGADATKDSAATAGLGFATTEGTATGYATELTVTSTPTGGKIVGGNGSAEGSEESGKNGADGITAADDLDGVALTLDSGVTVSGGNGANGSDDSASGSGGAGVSGSLTITVDGAAVQGGDGGSGTSGGSGGDGIHVTGDVAINSGTITGGDGGSATGDNGTGGTGGSGVDAESADVAITGGTVSGGDGGSATGDNGTGGTGGSGLNGNGTITGGTVTDGSSADETTTVTPTLSATATTITIKDAAEGTSYQLYDTAGNQIGDAVTAGADGVVTFSGLSSNTTYVVKATKDDKTTVVGTIQTSAPVNPSNVSGTGKVTGGTVSVSPAYPAAGEKVTITATPDSGYVLDSLKVLDNSGNVLSLTDNGNGTYSFTMPSGKVSVNAVFRETKGSYEICPKDDTCPISAFPDTDPTKWYHDGVHYCVEEKLMIGTSTTTFEPEISTSRAMIAQILWRLEGSPEVKYTLPYNDVADGKWYTEAVRWATSVGVVEGYGNGKFGPEDPITREQLATMLYRYEKKYGGGGFTGSWRFLLDFNDRNEVSDWAYEPICWMTMNGVIEGKGNGVLDPKGHATRAEAANMIFRYLVK